MKVLKSRAALLSDFEVLVALKDMEAEQKRRSEEAKLKKAAAAAAAAAATSTTVPETPDPEAQTTGAYQDQDEFLEQVPENLRTIQYETIAFLSQATRACAHQSESGITSFLDALKARGYSITDTEARRGGLGLNKSERLQIVNHSPVSVVELHTLVEELSERFYDNQVEEILQLVQTYIPAAPSGDVNVYADGNEGAFDGTVNGLAQETAEDEAMAAEHNGYDGPLDTAATDLGPGGENGLAVVPEHDEQDQSQDDAYEVDPAIEMDEDEFVNEGFGEGGVEDAEADD